jgi:predicted O-methyltransferase YrrM
MRNKIAAKMWSVFQKALRRVAPNLAMHVRPGHFYSPLLDLNGLKVNAEAYKGDGENYWDNVTLDASKQLRCLRELFRKRSLLPDFSREGDALRYRVNNHMFSYSDALILGMMIANEPPSHVIEIGSGYSTAVILDSMESIRGSCRIICVEPYPERLYGLLRKSDARAVQVIEQPVQELQPEIFDVLEDGDILFIDSSHVAKVDSDVSYLLLRILPRLRAGVRVHIHDIFYPEAYPIGWLREGRAWNESLFLRAFLIGNECFEVEVFNSFLSRVSPELIESYDKKFLEHPGGSLWLRKTM